MVAAFVRFNALDILFTPALAFAIIFNVRTSSFDHGRRIVIFFLAISAPFGENRACSMEWLCHKA
jgi:hypothetical protein